MLLFEDIASIQRESFTFYDFLLLSYIPISFHGAIRKRALIHTSQLFFASRSAGVASYETNLGPCRILSTNLKLLMAVDYMPQNLVNE